MQKFDLWGVRYGSVSPNMFPSLGCLSNWRNYGSLSCPDLDILATILKVLMWRGDVGSRERGEWKFFGIRESIVLDISAMTDILPESNRYT